MKTLVIRNLEISEKRILVSINLVCTDDEEAYFLEVDLPCISRETYALVPELVQEDVELLDENLHPLWGKACQQRGRCIRRRTINLLLNKGKKEEDKKHIEEKINSIFKDIRKCFYPPKITTVEVVQILNDVFFQTFSNPLS